MKYLKLLLLIFFLPFIMAASPATMGLMGEGFSAAAGNGGTPSLYSAVIQDSDYWDGTTSWAGEVDQAARDAKYGARVFATISAWETDRDGNASGTTTEYANIFGPWTVNDTAKVVFSGWTNKPPIIIQTIGTDARSQDGKFGSNNCYVQSSVTAEISFDVGEAGHEITFVGIQIDSDLGADGFYIDNDATITISKCFFRDQVAASKFVNLSGATVTILVVNSIGQGTGDLIKGDVGAGSMKIYNCTLEGSAGDCIEDDDGIWTVKNSAVFNNLDDFQDVNSVTYSASDDGDCDDATCQDISPGVEADGWNDAFTDYANGDYTIKDVGSVLYQNGESHTNDADVPTDDIVGTARVDGSESIGAYEL